MLLMNLLIPLDELLLPRMLNLLVLSHMYLLLFKLRMKIVLLLPGFLDQISVDLLEVSVNKIVLMVVILRMEMKHLVGLLLIQL